MDTGGGEEQGRLLQETIALLKDGSQFDSTLAGILKDVAVGVDSAREHQLACKQESKRCIEELLRRESYEENALKKTTALIAALEKELLEATHATQADAVKKEQAQREVEASKAHLQELELQEARLVAEKERVSTAVTHDLPLMRHLMNLHTSATKVKFVGEGSLLSEVKGFILNPGSLLPFSFDTSKHNRAAILSQLWDMMEEEW